MTTVAPMEESMTTTKTPRELVAEMYEAGTSRISPDWITEDGTFTREGYLAYIVDCLTDEVNALTDRVNALTDRVDAVDGKYTEGMWI